MIKNLQNVFKSPAMYACMLLIGFSLKAKALPTMGCSDAGVASASADSVCYNDPVTLTLSGYTGTVFQWQSSDGVNWVDETGTGSNSDTYQVALFASKTFRALVTQGSCPADTSNEITLTVGVIPVPTASSVSRCGPGMVNLVGTGAGTLEWFTNSVGGSPIATGSSPTVFIPASTTLYVADNVLGGGSLASPMQITELDLGNNDHLEIQNVSPTPFDVTGWKVLVSDNYTNINAVNINVQVLSGVLQPGDLITYTDAAGGPNYWGNNILWNPGAFPTFTGWALIVDDQNNPKDFVVWGWPDADIQNMSILIGGNTVTPQTIWSGTGIDATTVAATDGLSRIGVNDNDLLSDFAVLPLSLDATNPSMTIPFTGFGCTSPRIPVQVTITASDPISINASTTAICLSGSATFTASSNNSNYAYTWSPATGLNTTTGATVISTPAVTTTYIVIGDDGTCSNVDTVTLAVGAPTVAGIASSYQDTICLGKSIDLILTGSVGNVQWQIFNGTSWVNETGTGATSATYNVSPTANSTYRAYVSSGSCPPDSSNAIDIAVLSISDPTTTGASVCGNGSITLMAAGQGTLTWYTDPIVGTTVNTGTSYTYNATVTDTFYVDAFAGSAYNVGPANAGFGNQSTTISNNYGVGFDVIRPVTIEFVNVYPSTTGTITINLRVGTAGPVLATYSQSVTAFTGKTPIPIGFSVPVGTGYKLEIATGSASFQQNTSGATYPYSVVNGPLTITGYYNPNLNTVGTAYLWMYDWVIAEGCRSSRIPVIATVNAFPAIPTISQNWNSLTSSSPSGNQWYLNGNLIPGATDQHYEATQVGNYTVVVTVNGCSTTSSVFQVLTIGLNQIPSGAISMFPNPVNHNLNILITDQGLKFNNFRIIDVTGRTVYASEISNELKNETITVNTSAFAEGIYVLEMNSNDSILRKQFVVEH